MLLPILDLTFRNIALVVVFGVTFATIGLGFDQNRAATLARIVDRLLRYFITSDDVVAVHDVTRYAKRRGALSQVAHRRLLAGRR